MSGEAVLQQLRLISEQNEFILEKLDRILAGLAPPLQLQAEWLLGQLARDQPASAVTVSESRRPIAGSSTRSDAPSELGRDRPDERRAGGAQVTAHPIEKLPLDSRPPGSEELSRLADLKRDLRILKWGQRICITATILTLVRVVKQIGESVRTVEASPGLIEVGETREDGGIRYWRAKEGVRQGEVALAAQDKNLSSMDTRASSILTWAVTGMLALAAVLADGKLIIIMLPAAACLFVAAIACVYSLWPRAWSSGGYDAKALAAWDYGTELEYLEAVALGYAQGLADNDERLRRFQIALRFAWCWFLAAPILALGSLLVFGTPADRQSSKTSVAASSAPVTTTPRSGP